MEGYFPAKLKRKDLDEVNDDFCDFSLSSPARKIRRLDAELPPIIEEEEMLNPVVFEQPVPSQDTFVEQTVRSNPIAINEINGSLPENEERAIVLYDPMNNIPSLQPRSPFSISVNPNFLSGFKNPILWSNQSHLLESFNGETEKHDDKEKNNGSLAVVPWVAPPEHHRLKPEVEVSEAYEMMDSDDMEAITMDMEDDNSQQISRNEIGEGVKNQWQQHCMIPQAPHLSAPIAWSSTGI